LPRAAAQALTEEFLVPWAEHGGDAWERWLPAIDQFCASLARLCGGRAMDYSPQANVSVAFSRLLGSLPPPAERNVWLLSEDAFPSLAFVLYGARRLGFEFRIVPRKCAPNDLGAWADRVTPDVCGILVMHAHSNTGVVAPVADFAALCRVRDLWCVVDVAQSAGILPIDVDAWRIDALLGSSLKWLCGGPGAGFLWVNPARLPALQPSDIGWFSHARPFEFDIHAFEYAPDARRFWGGTPAMAPYVMAARSITLLLDHGIDAIRAHNRQLQREFASALPARWRERVVLDGRGGTICLDAGSELESVRGALDAADVRVDYRGSIVRQSFHVYNTVNEAHAAAGAWPKSTR
jgi:selenocysteine lyase/cysteine desulfurase